MKCEDCKYFHRLKHNFKQFKGFEESSCCIALTREGEDIDDYDVFVIEASKNDKCELFCKK